MATIPKLDICGCCDGVEPETPVMISNLPAQSQLAYRVGTHAKFKSSMIAALARAEHPALKSLGTRDDDDFTIAYIDGVATVLDVLTFYQERYGNEHYLRTCSERRSVQELAQLIGYELSPGVAASTYLAFTLQEVPGDEAANNNEISIPPGTRAQSVPGQDEMPQVFETSEIIQARAAWNAVPVQTTKPYQPEFKDIDVYLAGVTNNIEEGDAILIVGQHRIQNPGSERWDVRVVKAVELDNDNQRTRLVWDVPLGHEMPLTYPSEADVRLYVFRKRESLFGYNAPDPSLMSTEGGSYLENMTGDTGTSRVWSDYKINGTEIDLANPEKRVVAGSWIALLSNSSNFGTPDLPGYLELYRVSKVVHRSRTAFGISGKITRIIPDTDEHIEKFKLDKTLAFVASEQLDIYPRPILYPLYSDIIKLKGRLDGVMSGQFLSITGQRQRLKIAAGITDLVLDFGDGTRTLSEGDSVVLIGIPEVLMGGTAIQLSPSNFGALIDNSNATVILRLSVVDRDGVSGQILGSPANWKWDHYENDPFVSEVVQISVDDDAVLHGRNRSSFTLETSLKNIYHRESVRCNFNTAPCNHGESVEEILGDGDQRKADQSFVLKQGPLTYISADKPSGAIASLELRINDLLWEESSTLYNMASDARVYKVQNNDDGSATIQFGDGVEGGRLPSGQTNVRARYRKYVGSDANLDRARITTLLQKPLGVTEVTNPEPSTGGTDPEVIEDARDNAPLTVLTLDRAVSILDYRNYARAFSGISKAHAIWIPAGAYRGVYITIAGIDGAIVPDTSETFSNLLASLRRYGDPLLPLHLVNYTASSFALGLAVKVHPAASREIVLNQLELELREHFSFRNRAFGQHINQDEILATAHNVDYIEAVRITRFYQIKPGAVDTVVSVIPSSLPVASLTIAPEPAQLVTLSPEPIQMEVFS